MHWYLSQIFVCEVGIFWLFKSFECPLYMTIHDQQLWQWVKNNVEYDLHPFGCTSCIQLRQDWPVYCLVIRSKEGNECGIRQGTIARRMIALVIFQISFWCSYILVRLDYCINFVYRLSIQLMIKVELFWWRLISKFENKKAADQSVWECLVHEVYTAFWLSLTKQTVCTWSIYCFLIESNQTNSL